MRDEPFFLVRQDIDARLVILGEGDMRNELEQLISELGLEEHVALPGFCENPFSVMKRADLFVLSSIWEGLILPTCSGHHSNLVNWR